MPVFLLAVLFFCLGYPAVSAAQLGDYLQFPQVFPERDVFFVAGGLPEWKKDWDNGRWLFRAGDLKGAAESYQKLLAAKANIEEARWELVVILAGLEEWEKARSELELLVEVAPDNVDYLNALGLALRHTSQLGRALDIFGKVRERAPENFIALVGQVQGLMEAGRKKDALPLLQEIVAKKPDDRDLALVLATMAYEQGQTELARRLLVSLTSSKKVEMETLLFAARLHDGLGKEKEAAVYWERVLAMDPAQREAHGWLARYLENQGHPDKALPHLQFLLEQDSQNISILSRICRIYLDSNAPFTEASPYYEKYLRLRPDDLDFIRALNDQTSGREDEQTALFRLLLAISPDELGLFSRLAVGWEAAANPEKALEMWERLARIVPERLEVYRALLRLLEQPGREARLLQVLETIHRLAPDDRETLGRLARLMVARGDLNSGLKYYNTLEQVGYHDSDLYAARLAIYEKLGQPSLALPDYERLLALSPERGELFRRALYLAGELGDVAFLVKAAVEVERGPQSNTPIQEQLLLAEAFAAARDFSRSVRYYRLVMDSQAGVAGSGRFLNLVRQARLGLARMYRREGLAFEAEQLLREGLLVDSEPGVFLRQLFELSLSLEHPEPENGRVWLARYLGSSPVDEVEAALLQARWLVVSGDLPHAEELLRQLLNPPQDGEGRQPSREGVQVRRQAGMLMAEILLESGELVAAEHQCLAIAGAESDPEVLALLHDVYLRAGETTAAGEILHGIFAPGGDAIRQLQLLELLQQRGLAASQMTVIEALLRQWPNSLRAASLKIEALVRAGKKAEALQYGTALFERWPESATVVALNARLAFLAGQYPEAVDFCKRTLAVEPERFDVKYLMVRCEVAQGNRLEGVRLVRELYPEEGVLVLTKRLTEAGLPLPQPPSRTLWQILTFEKPPFDLVAEMLKAGAFFDQTLPERNKVNELLAALLVPLRWEKFFRAALLANP